MQHREVQIIHWINIKDIENSINWASHEKYDQTYINDPDEFTKEKIISPPLHEKGSSIQEINWIG